MSENSGTFPIPSIPGELSIGKLLKCERYDEEGAAESIIVRAMFPQAELCDETGISGYGCTNCGDAAIHER
jgi:hypothetical protein